MKGDFLFMKSICIKMNNNIILNYLLDEFKNISIGENISISKKSFKYYNNLIVHYKGDNLSLFYNQVCDILLNTVIKFYEVRKLKELININYFYFSEFERQSILNYCTSLLENDKFKREDCNKFIYIEFLYHIINNKSLYLDGFINFRLYKYVNLLDDIVDTSVNNYIIEREYNEFIDLLKIYINNKDSTMDLIHLIYMDGESFLMDEERNIVSIDDNILNAPYLSDISFSSNDFTLNSLLCVIPNKIIIHIIDKEDDFINTIKLIFGKRVSVCTDCNICNIYKNLSEHIILKNK